MIGAKTLLSKMKSPWGLSRRRKLKLETESPCSSPLDSSGAKGTSCAWAVLLGAKVFLTLSGESIVCLMLRWQKLLKNNFQKKGKS